MSTRDEECELDRSFRFSKKKNWRVESNFIDDSALARVDLVRARESSERNEC